MNLTLAVDERTVDAAREVAREQGTSLNALIREYIEHLAGARSGQQLLERMEQLWTTSAGASSGYKFDREDAYEGRSGMGGSSGRSRLR